jgi:signal transduction histidine kinase
VVLQDELGHATRDLRTKARELKHSRSELRAVQNELGRKQHLAVIGEMAAVIAHEVRNPLAVISNAVSSLRRDGLSRHDHDVLLSILAEEAARLNQLVNDLLSYTRPVNIQRQRVVLSDVLQRSTLLGANRGSTTIQFEPDNVRGQVWGDPNLLRRVFDNIVENSIQATGSRGTVRIAIEATSRDSREGFVVRVSDDGEGMDTQVRRRAKDPFFTTRPEGTGLGLAIVSRLVEAHGGEVDIDSEAGEGTTVSVFLPIGTEAASESEAPLVREQSGTSEARLDLLSDKS